MLGWGQAQLSEAAGVSRMTIVDFEKGARTPHPNNLAAIRAALEAAGVEFTNGDAPGVRLHSQRGDRVKVEVLGRGLVGYAPVLPKGHFQPPAPGTGHQTKGEAGSLSFGLRWAYGEISALLFESEDDARKWPGVEFIPENGGGAGVRMRKPGA